MKVRVNRDVDRNNNENQKRGREVEKRDKRGEKEEDQVEWEREREAVGAGSLVAESWNYQQESWLNRRFRLWGRGGEGRKLEVQPGVEPREREPRTSLSLVHSFFEADTAAAASVKISWTALLERYGNNNTSCNVVRAARAAWGRNKRERERKTQRRKLNTPRATHAFASSPSLSLFLSSSALSLSLSSFTDNLNKNQTHFFLLYPLSLSLNQKWLRRLKSIRKESKKPNIRGQNEEYWTLRSQKHGSSIGEMRREMEREREERAIKKAYLVLGVPKTQRPQVMQQCSNSSLTSLFTKLFACFFLDLNFKLISCLVSDADAVCAVQMYCFQITRIFESRRERGVVGSGDELTRKNTSQFLLQISWDL